MSENFYAAPEAELDSSTAGQVPHFYVVSQKKFLVLLMGTTGLYLVYWFWRNWHMYRTASGEKLWPVLRAVLMLFYTHSLLRLIDQHLARRGLANAWQPGAQATTIVVCMLLYRVADNLAIRDLGAPYTLLLSIVLLFAIGVNLLPVQKAVNRAEGDIHGLANNDFSAANIGWLVFGILIWVLALADLFHLLPAA